MRGLSASKVPFKDSDFALDDKARFAWQHDPLPAGRDTVRLFDNDANGIVTNGESRVEWLRLDRRKHTTTLVRQVTHPAHLRALAGQRARAAERRHPPADRLRAQALDAGGRVIGASAFTL